jgi:hypothetical protein
MIMLEYAAYTPSSAPVRFHTACGIVINAAVQDGSDGHPEATSNGTTWYTKSQTNK